MKTVFVTGSKGFVGKNLMEALRRRSDVLLLEADVDTPETEWRRGLDEADAIVHLAGANRPSDVREFEAVNEGVTEMLLARIGRRSVHPLVVFASSIQATADNPYGRSKRRAEELIAKHCRERGTGACIYRLTNLFGKWCRPNYNSVVATFCHNILRDLPIAIDQPDKALELLYIDDLVSDLITTVFDRPHPEDVRYLAVEPVYSVTLARLAELIRSFKDVRRSLVVPDMSDPFTRKLYATYMSHHEGRDVAYALEMKEDARGALAEAFKSPCFGQIFVSRTKPGVVRGNHFHDTKVEKFCVVQGEAVLRFRHIANGDAFEVRVRGEDFKVVDIPPGYTHSIENVSDGDMVVLFWANEIFDSGHPDTFFAEV